MEHEDKQGHNLAKHIDFGQIREEIPLKKRHLKKYLRFTAYILGGIVGFILLFALAYAHSFYAMYQEGMIAKQKLEEAQHALINRNFEGGAVALAEAHVNLVSVQRRFDGVILIRWLPWVSHQVKAVDALLVAAVEFTGSGVELVRLGDAITKDIRNETLIFSEISDRHKREIIAQLVAAQPTFEAAQVSIHKADEAIKNIKTSALLKPLADIVDPLQQYLPIARSMIDQAMPLVQVLPKVVGFDETKTYLFLLQNNYELRPTGGFIGTYGIVKLRNGEIEQLITDNIYNLDRAFEDDELTLTPQQIMNRPAPLPIQVYLEQRQWALRDGNWAADFPTAARDTIDLYNEESRIARDIEKQIYLRNPQNKESEFESRFLEEGFDGVIAITPEIIENLLKLTGPVVVDGIRFTDENFQEELSFRVTYQFEELGIEDRARKDIIKRIADEIKARITSMPYARLLDVAQIGIESLESKSVLIYATDPELQELLLEKGWAGEIVQTNTDYLFVVDTNLGSLKTDQFIDRFVTYSIEKKGDQYIATARIKHKHNGQFAWNSTRLRSYTRVYVPLGSELLEFSGSMVNDSVKDPDRAPGKIDVWEEYNKTVFGAFIATEPREEQELVVVYQLPDYVAQSIENGSYALLYQKQPGTSHYLTVDLQFGKSIKSSSPAGQVSGLLNPVYHYETAIMKDTWIVLSL